MARKKIGLAVITKNIDRLSPYLDFMENAELHNHQIKHLIIVFSHKIKHKIFIKLKKIARTKSITVHPVKAVADSSLKTALLEKGLDTKEVNSLLFSPLLEKYGLLPYGYYRNIALLKALVLEIRYLFFIDTDVYPRLLLNIEGDYYFKEIDFFGKHLKYIEKDEIDISSSDYSGYYIIPAFSFLGLKELLSGLQKEKAYNFVSRSRDCLIFANRRRKIRPTNKLLGGNLALDLDSFDCFPPFFSTTYIFENKLYLGRGEDTLLGKEIWKNGGQALDIDLRIFHDTFGNFPELPETNSRRIKDRFYYAAMGWLGRNPFLNWLNFREKKLSRLDFETKKEKEYRDLLVGSKALASYLEDSRFLKLPEAFKAAYDQLDDMILEYYNTIEAWQRVQSIFCKKECEVDAPSSGKSFSS